MVKFLDVLAVAVGMAVEVDEVTLIAVVCSQKMWQLRRLHQASIHRPQTPSSEQQMGYCSITPNKPLYHSALSILQVENYYMLILPINNQKVRR